MESLERKRQREIHRRRSRQTQATLNEFLQMKEAECQHEIHQRQFASQTYTTFNDWWTQTHPTPIDEVQVQTDSCLREVKEIQTEQLGEEKEVQTVEKGLNDLFVYI